MKIYTRKGDRGTTTLLTGERVAKDDPRLAAYGTVDELVSYTGLLRDLCRDDGLRDILLAIQRDLMTVASRLAATRPLPSLPDLADERITFLEQEIDRMNDELPPLRSFIIPGGSPLSSHCHVARTICRRAERACVTLLHEQTYAEQLVRYLNRLSDYLFVMARYLLHREGKDETIW